MSYKYHYKGFEIEDLGDGYKVAVYHYKTLKEAMADIDRHIDTLHNLRREYTHA